jgi:hypothetical protein
MHQSLHGSGCQPVIDCCVRVQVYDTNLESQRQGLQQQLAKRIDDFSGTIAGFGSR